MKYSKSAIGLLTAQYRSVLKKCWMINVGLFALIGATFATPAEAGGTELVTYNGGLLAGSTAVTGTTAGSVNLSNYIDQSDLTGALASYATTASLSSYAKTTDLNNYYTKNELTSATGVLSAYATNASLAAYAKTADLSAYASQSLVDNLQTGNAAFSGVLIGTSAANGAVLTYGGTNLVVNKGLEVNGGLTLKNGSAVASLGVDGSNNVTAANFKADKITIGTSTTAIDGVETAITDSSSGTKVATAAAVKTYADGLYDKVFDGTGKAFSSFKMGSANITGITNNVASTSTDSELATAKAVYTAVNTSTSGLQDAIDKINGTTDATSVTKKITDAFAANTAANMADSTEQNKFAKVSQINSAIATAKEGAEATAQGYVTDLQNGAVKENADAIAILNGSSADSVAGKIVAQAKNATYSGETTIAQAITKNATDIATLTATSGDGSIADMIKDKASDATYNASSATGSLGAKIASNDSRITANEGKLAGITGTVTGAIDTAVKGADGSTLDIGGLADKVRVGKADGSSNFTGLVVDNDGNTATLSTAGDKKTYLSLDGNNNVTLGGSGNAIKMTGTGEGAVISFENGISANKVEFEKGVMKAAGANLGTLTLNNKPATDIDTGTNYSATAGSATTLATTATVYASVNGVASQLTSLATKEEVHGKADNTVNVTLGENAPVAQFGTADNGIVVNTGLGSGSTTKAINLKVTKEAGATTSIAVAPDSVKIGSTTTGTGFDGIEYNGSDKSVTLGNGTKWVKATEGNLTATGNISTANGTVSGKQLIAGTDGLVVDGKTLTSVDTGANLVPAAASASSTIIASQKTVRTALDEAQKYTPAGTSVVYSGATTVSGALDKAGVAIDTLNGDASTTGSVLNSIQANAKDATYSGSGASRVTIAQAIAANEARFEAGTHLPAFDATEKVADYLDDNAELAKYTPAGTGATPTTIQAAIRANDAKLAGLKLADASAADTVQAAIESFATKAKTDATAYTPTATVYSGATTVSGALDKAGVAIDTLNDGVGVENSVDYKVYNNAKDALYKAGATSAENVTIAQAIKANTDTFGTLDVVSGQAATVQNAIAKAKKDVTDYTPAATSVVYDSVTTVAGALDNAGAAIDKLNGDASTTGSVLKSVKENASDATYDANSAEGTLGGKITSNASRIAANEGKLAGITGTVTDYVKVNAELADYTPAAGAKTTIQAAIQANDAKLAGLTMADGTTPAATVQAAINSLKTSVSDDYVTKAYLVSGDTAGQIKFGKEFDTTAGNPTLTAANIGIDTTQNIITAQVRNNQLKTQSISLDAANGMILTSKQEHSPETGVITETVTLKDGNVTASKKVSAADIEATASVQGATLIATAATDGLTLNGTTASSIDNVGAAVADEPTDSKTLASTKTVYSSVKALADGQVKLNKDAITKLNGTVDQDGSVLKSIKENAELADFTPAGEGATKTTIQAAIRANTAKFGDLGTNTVEEAIDAAKSEAQAYDPADALKAEGAIFENADTNKEALDIVGTKITTLNGDANTTGSVLNSIKTTAKDATYKAATDTTPAVTIAEAIQANADAIDAEHLEVAEGADKTVVNAIAKAKADASAGATDALNKVLDGTTPFSKLSMGADWAVAENADKKLAISDKTTNKEVAVLDKNGISLNTISGTGADPESKQYFVADKDGVNVYNISDTSGTPTPTFKVYGASGNIESNGTLTLKDATVGNQTLDAAKIKQITTNQTNIGVMSTLNGGSNAMTNRDPQTGDPTTDASTLVQAANNISATLGDIHGLKAKVAGSTNEWYKNGAGNLYAGSSVEDHLTELAASVGKRDGFLTGYFTKDPTGAATTLSAADAIMNMDAAVYAATGNLDFTSGVNYVQAGDNITQAIKHVDGAIKSVADDYVTKAYFNNGDTSGSTPTNAISMGAGAKNIVIGHKEANTAENGSTLTVDNENNKIEGYIFDTDSRDKTNVEISKSGLKVASTDGATSGVKNVVVADGNVTADETVKAKNLEATDGALVGTETGGTLAGVKLSKDGTVVATDSFTAGVAGTAPYSQITKGGATFAGATGTVTIADGVLTAPTINGTTVNAGTLAMTAGGEATKIDNAGDVISTQPTDGKTLASTLTVYKNVHDATTVTAAARGNYAAGSIKNAVASIDKAIGNRAILNGTNYANPGTSATTTNLSQAIKNMDAAIYGKVGDVDFADTMNYVSSADTNLTKAIKSLDTNAHADIAKRKVTVGNKTTYGLASNVGFAKVEDDPDNSAEMLTIDGATTWLDATLGIASSTATPYATAFNGAHFITNNASTTMTSAIMELDSALYNISDDYVTWDYFNNGDTSGSTPTNKISMGSGAKNITIGHVAVDPADKGTNVVVDHTNGKISANVVTAAAGSDPATTTALEVSKDGAKVVNGGKNVTIAGGNVTADETVSAKNLEATDSALVGTDDATNGLTGVKLDKAGTVVASDSFTAGVAGGTDPYSQITKGGATFAGANGTVTIADGSVTADGTTWAKTSLKLGAAGSEATAIDNLGDVISTQPSDGKTLASTLTVYNNIKDAMTIGTAGTNYAAGTVKTAIADLDTSIGERAQFNGTNYARPDSASATDKIDVATAIKNMDSNVFAKVGDVNFNTTPAMHYVSASDTSLTAAIKSMDTNIYNAISDMSDDYVTWNYFNGKNGAAVIMGRSSNDIEIGKQEFNDGGDPIKLKSGIKITNGTANTIEVGNYTDTAFYGIQVSNGGQTVTVKGLNNDVVIADGKVTAKSLALTTGEATDIDNTGTALDLTTDVTAAEKATLASVGTVKASLKDATIFTAAGLNYANGDAVKAAITKLDTAMGARNFTETHYAKLENTSSEITKAITNLDTALYGIANDYVTKSYFNNGEPAGSTNPGLISMGSGATTIQMGKVDATSGLNGIIINNGDNDKTIKIGNNNQNVTVNGGDLTATGNVKGATLEATNSALVGTETGGTLAGVKLNSDGTVVASDSFTAGVAGTAPYSQITKGGATFAGANKTVSIADGTVTAAELALTSGSATAIDDTGNSIDLTTVVSDAEKATLASVGTVKATIKDATEVTAATNGNYAAGTVKTAVADLDAAIGERTYTTAQPHLTTGQTVVASLKALDEAIVDISDDFVTWNYFNNGDTNNAISMGSGAKEITVGSAADNIVVNTEDHQVKAAVAGTNMETKVEVNDGNIKIGTKATNVDFSGLAYSNTDQSVTFTSASSNSATKSVKIADGTVTADTSFKIGTASEATAFDNTTAAITSAVATADGAEKKMANIAEVYNTVNTNAEKSIFTPASDAVYVAGTNTINGAITALDVAADTNAKEIAKRKVTVDNKATLGKASNVQYAKVEDGTNEAEMLTIGGATAWLDSTLGIASSTTTPYATAFDGAHFITNNASTTMTSAIMDLDSALYGIADDYVTWTYFNGGDAANNIVSMARNAKKTFIGAQTGTVDADNNFIPSAITTGVAIDTTTDDSHTIKVVANTTNGLSADASSAKLTAGTNAIISVASDGGIKLGTEVSGTLTGIAMTENGNNVTFNGLNKKVNVKNGVVTADVSVVVGDKSATTPVYAEITDALATFAGATGTVTIADGTVTNKKLVFSGDNSYATAIDNTGGVFSSTVTPSKYTLASTQTVYDNTTVADAANGNYAAGSVIAALGSIDTAIGNRTYNNPNYLTTGESVTTSLAALDKAIGDISDDYVTWDYFNGGEAATLPDGTTANPNAGLVSMGSGAKNILIGKTSTASGTGITSLDAGLAVNNTNGNVMLGKIAHLDSGDAVETGVNIAGEHVSLYSANGQQSVNGIDVDKTTVKMGIITTDTSGNEKFAGVTLNNGVMTNINADTPAKQSTLSSEALAITDGTNTSSVKADEVKVAASTTDYTSTTAAGTTVTKKDGDTTYTAKVEADKMSVTDGDNIADLTATGVGVKDKDGNTADLTADGVSIKNKDGKHTADLTSTALTMDDSDNKTTVKADGMTVENTDAGTKTTVAAGSIEVKDANGTTKISGAGVETGSLKLGTSTQVANAISDGSAVADYAPGTAAETIAKSTLATNATVKATVDGVVADIEKQIHGDEDHPETPVTIGEYADHTIIGNVDGDGGATSTNIDVNTKDNMITLSASQNPGGTPAADGTDTSISLNNATHTVEIGSANTIQEDSAKLTISNDANNHSMELAYKNKDGSTLDGYDGLKIDADNHQFAMVSSQTTTISGQTTTTSYGMTIDAKNGNAITKFEDQDGEGITFNRGDLTATNSATVGDSSTANYAKIEEVKDATSGAVTGMKATFATQSGNTVIEDGSIKADHNITASDSVLAGSEDATSGALTGVKLKSDGTAQASTSVLAGTEDATSGALSGVKMNADGTLAASKSALVGVEAADGEYIKLETDATNGAKATFSSADGSVEVAKGEVTADNKVTVGDNTNSVVLDKGGNVTATNSALIGSETDDGQGNKTLTGVKMDKDGNAQASAKSTVGQVDANGDLSGNGVQMKNDGSATFASQAGNVKVSDGKVVADNEVTVGDASGTDYASVVKGTDGKVTATFASGDGNVVIAGGNVTADGTVKGDKVVADTEFELAGTKVHSIDTGVDGEGKPQKSAPAADALATTASVYANAEDALYTPDSSTYVTANAATINEAFKAVDNVIGNFPAGLNKDLVDPTKTSSNLTNGGELEPATILDAFNNIDATMGTIHGLKAKHEAARLAQDGKVYHSNLEDGTTIEMHLSKLDDAIGDRTTITNENGSNNYAFSTDTMYVADVLTDLASQIGTAKDLGKEKNGVKASQTVNQNIAALNNTIGDVSELNNTEYAKGDTIVESIQNVDNKLSNLDTRMERAERDLKDVHHELRRGMASMAAMSALVPNSRSTGKTSLSVGTGAYSGHGAVAVGGFHYLTDNLMFNAGAAWSNSRDAVYRVGMTYSF